MRTTVCWCVDRSGVGGTTTSTTPTTPKVVSSARTRQSTAWPGERWTSNSTRTLRSSMTL